MIERRPRPSAPLAWLSPSAFEVLHACRLWMSYSRSGEGVKSSPTAYQVLGDVCHRVLERLVASRAILEDEWQARMEEEFEAAINDAVEALEGDAQDALLGPPPTWPGFAARRARLQKACSRLRILLQGAGSDAAFVCEQPMTALETRLRGRPDLIVRDSAHHWVVDYKTGAVLEGETELPKAGYVRQLRLYAAMEREASGVLPDHAWLVPLKGTPVEVPIAEEDCAAAAEEFLSELDAYNETAPDAQPGSPSVDACGWCPHAGTCPEFWSACGEEWAAQLLAARGSVIQAQSTVIGGVTVSVAVDRGSVPHDRISVRGISSSEHPAALGLEPGSEVAIRGLRPLSEDSATFTLWPGASVWALS